MTDRSGPHHELVPQTRVIASGWTSQCLILQKGRVNLGVERISQESQLEQKDVYKNQLQGNKKKQLFKNAEHLEI